MKKFILFIIFLIPTNVFSMTSTTLMDMDNGRLLYGSNSNQIGLIASTTKIMTAIVAINYGNLDKEYTIDKDVLKSYGSGIYIEVGEEISLLNLLYGLMLRSGNDAAIEIANIVGGSMEGFVRLMNEQAINIGMKKTKFINASGLENENGEGNTSTGIDMAKLMSYAMKNEIFKNIVSTKQKTVKTNYKTYLWYNKNKLLNNYEYCTGGKTGFTEKARRTLVTTATKNNINFVIVTLNDSNDFANHKMLYEKYFDIYKSVQILNKEIFKIEGKNYYIKNDYYFTCTNKEKSKIKTNIIMYENNTSDIVGYIDVLFENKKVHKEYIYEKEIIKKENWFAKLKKFFGEKNG